MDFDNFKFFCWPFYSHDDSTLDDDFATDHFFKDDDNEEDTVMGGPRQLVSGQHVNIKEDAIDIQTPLSAAPSEPTAAVFPVSAQICDTPIIIVEPGTPQLQICQLATSQPDNDTIPDSQAPMVTFSSELPQFVEPQSQESESDPDVDDYEMTIIDAQLEQENLAFAMNSLKHCFLDEFRNKTQDIISKKRILLSDKLAKQTKECLRELDACIKQAPLESAPSFSGVSKIGKVNTKVLKEWLVAHKNYPYPSTEEKDKLMKLSNSSQKQLENWFVNARKRILKLRKEEKKPPVLLRKEALLEQMKNSFFLQEKSD